MVYKTTQLFLLNKVPNAIVFKGASHAFPKVVEQAKIKIARSGLLWRNIKLCDCFLPCIAVNPGGIFFAS
jgi:hypothetical protein